MEVGDRVEVHTRFNNSWVRGFEVAAVVGFGYRLCRISDGTVLPSVTSESDLRREPPDRSAHTTDVEQPDPAGGTARTIAVLVAERSPLLAARAPSREPPVLAQHIMSAHRAERHRRGEPSSAVALRHRHRRAEDRVVGWASAVRTTAMTVTCPDAELGRSMDHRPSGLSSASALAAHRRCDPVSGTLPNRADRHGGQSHQSGIVPGNSSGSPGNMSRQRPH